MVVHDFEKNDQNNFSIFFELLFLIILLNYCFSKHLILVFNNIVNLTNIMNNMNNLNNMNSMNNLMKYIHQNSIQDLNLFIEKFKNDTSSINYLRIETSPDLTNFFWRPILL